MRVENGRVRLRAVQQEDLDRVAEYLSHDELSGVRAVDGDRDRPMSRVELADAVASFPKPEHGEVFGIWVDDELVGHSRIDWWWDAHTPSMQVVIEPGSRRAGLGSAAARLVLHHLFEDSLAHLTDVWIPDWNTAGVAFAQSLGYSQVGTARRTGVRHGAYVDALVFCLSRAGWERSCR